MSRLALIVTSTAQPGRRDEIFAMYEELLVPRALDNDDQQVVVWVDDQADPDTFHLFEIYASGEAFRANASSEWFAEYFATAGPLLAGEPSMTMGAPRWTMGVPS